jgi:hypothetical protein
MRDLIVIRIIFLLIRKVGVGWGLDGWKMVLMFFMLAFGQIMIVAFPKERLTIDILCLPVKVMV